MKRIAKKARVFLHFSRRNSSDLSDYITPQANLPVSRAVFLIAKTLFTYWRYSGCQLDFCYADKQGFETSGVPP